MNGELAALLAHPQLYVQQRKEWTEILIDWETRNKYAVLDDDRRELAWIAERATGLGGALKRAIFRSHRAFEIDVIDRSGIVMINLSRSFFWFFSDLEVRIGEERMGSVRRRFGLLHKRYDLHDQTGDVIASISSPLWRLWRFPISGTSASIAKKWGGALREFFTDADTYLVDFADHPWTPQQRAVILAAAISIDFDFFENNQGRGGGVLDVNPSG